MPTTLITLLAIAVIVLAVRLKTQRDTLARQIKSVRKKRDEALAKLQLEVSDSQVSLDALSDAFFIVTDQLEIKKCNARAKEIFRKQELLGRHLPEVLMSPSFTRHIERMVASHRPEHQRIILPANAHKFSGHTSDGETAWIIQVTPLPDHATTPQFCIILRDISTEHRTDQIRTDFVANASHELRTPLAIINGYLENLLDDGIIEEPQMAKKMLVTMRKHGSRLSRLIDDMLVVSRLESGENTAINKEPFDLIECAEDVLDRLEQIITTTNTQIIRQFPTTPITLNGDRFYWTQIMFNLLENAMKQNPNRQLTIHFSITQLTPDTLQISISDNGIGIPSAHLPFIFKRFYRVDKHHTQSDIKGTGLGLSIVKRAIEAHNGTIEATSQPGIKTTFCITVPVA